MFLSFLRARVIEGHFGIETIHFLLIELNSIRFGGNMPYEFASYRETTYYVPGTRYVLSMFFRSE